MIKTIYCLAALLCALYFLDGNQNSARAADQGIVATVNDIPITSFDIDQRLAPAGNPGPKAGRQ